MAIYKDPLAPSSKSSISRDPLKPDAEDEHEVSQFEAALNGIASGILKIPEGFVSLGAEIMDATGMTTNAAAKLHESISISGLPPEIFDARQFKPPIEKNSVHQGAALEVESLQWGSLEDIIMNVKYATMK